MNTTHLNPPYRDFRLLVCIAGLIAGVLVFLFPSFVLAASIAAGIVGLIAIARKQLPLWQGLAALTLLGYAVLNYGMDNLALRIGNLPIPIGQVVLFLALALAVTSNPPGFRLALSEPVVKLWLILLAMTSVHMLTDLPRYGGSALRDTSIIVEGVFLFLGYLWATNSSARRIFHGTLSAMFVLNLIYAMTYPWREQLTLASPTVGVFRPVSLLGHYGSTSLFLLSGAVYFFLVWPSHFGRPRIRYLLIVLQIACLALAQERSMYLGTLLVLLMLFVFWRKSQAIKLTLVLAVGVSVVFGLISIMPVELEGRLGPVKLEFLKRHAASLVGDSERSYGTVLWRVAILEEAWDRSTATTNGFLFGEGFGRSLTSERGRGGVAIRQPHNSHLSILMRLGLAGLAVWLALNACLTVAYLKRVLSAPTQARRALYLWFLIHYALSMLMTTVQPNLEFSHGAILFFAITGFAIATLRIDSGDPRPHSSVGLR